MSGQDSSRTAKLPIRFPKMASYAVISLVAISLMVGGYLLYRESVTQAVNVTTTSFMSQIADHDAQSIYNQINHQWNSLESLTERLLTTREDDLGELSYQLSVESRTSSFTKIYLITADETVHDSALLTTTLDKKRWADAYRSTETRSVMRYDLNEPELWGEFVMYTVKLEKPMLCQGELIEGVVGLSPVQGMEEGLRFESFDGRGVAIVVQSSGAVVTASEYYQSDDGENYFDQLEGASFLSGSYDGMRASIESGKDAVIEYEIAEGRYYASIMPIQDSDWYLAVKVNSSVMSDQVNELLSRSLLFFGAMGVLIVAVAVVIIRSVRDARVARASEHAKSTFLANMSHEIRTPLNGLVGLQYLMRQNIDDRERLVEYLDQADASASFLKSIITDVLDMSKIESGQMGLYKNPFSLAASVRDIESMMMPQMRARSLSFVIDDAGVFAPDVVGDEMRIKQIIVNLLGNAVKFTPEGGHVALSVSQRAGSNGVPITEFRVSDTGCGMSADFLSRIWEPFEQEQRTASQNGTGLGTALSKILAEAMGGIIDVESTEGVGTTFTVSLPLPVSDEEPPASVSEEAVPADTLEGRHVLVAEDNAVNRMIIVDILTDEGCEVTEANDGRAALDAFKASEEGAFDVVLMDLQMPEMNGYEAAAAIRALARGDAQSIPIIALTANAFREDVARALNHGMNDVVTKPLDVSLLLEKLKALGSN